MPLTTGNKSEMSVGYATLYGDMCGGYSVLKDVYKTTVFAISNWRNKHFIDGFFGPEGIAIPDRVINKKPSAELKPDQFDEDSLPPYDVLDDILSSLIEEERAVDDIVKKGADVLALGIAPSGGKIPSDWLPMIELALNAGLCIINGLHDTLGDRYNHKIKDIKKQWIWDVRIPNISPKIASAKAAELSNKRVLMIGTDMACGKMTAGLEIYKWAKNNDINTGFIATGQIGITLMGQGIPLDAIKVDHACGAVEQIVLKNRDKSLLIIEGQGSLLHPGSSATLPLICLLYTSPSPRDS